MDILSHFVYSIVDCLHSFVPDVFSPFPRFSTRVTEVCRSLFLSLFLSTHLPLYLALSSARSNRINVSRALPSIGAAAFRRSSVSCPSDVFAIHHVSRKLANV